MDFKNIFSFNSQEQQDQGCFPNLSWNQRLIGFALCCALGIDGVIIGYLIQILSFGAFLSLATGNPTKFAIIYSIGNILALTATGFLLGFKRQCQNMVDPERRICTMIFVAALIGTVVSALVFHSRLLVLLFLIIQIPAYIWYCASYIPFARDCIKGCLRGITDRFR